MPEKRQPKKMNFPDWFKPQSYLTLKSASFRDWWALISTRRSVEIWLSTRTPQADDALKRHFGTLENPQQGPSHIGANMFGVAPNVLTGKAKILGDMTIAQVLFLARKIANESPHVYSIFERIMEQKGATNEEWEKLYESAGEYIHLNLSLTRDELKAAFEAWLNGKKPRANASKKKRALTTGDLGKWDKWKLLPAIDIKQWAKYSGQEIKLLNALDSKKFGDIDHGERLSARMKDLLSDATLEWLRHAVAREQRDAEKIDVRKHRP
ncbi:MAG: DUF6387 family protein [Rudaea sp.]|uniref:DUF6387 family protein n=1 Tax=Rudaea sp. TaxID=2136325 RepID=UPI0039E2A290